MTVPRLWRSGLTAPVGFGSAAVVTETLLRPATESVNGEIEALSHCVLASWRSKNQTQRRKDAAAEAPCRRPTGEALNANFASKVQSRRTRWDQPRGTPGRRHRPSGTWNLSSAMTTGQQGRRDDGSPQRCWSAASSQLLRKLPGIHLRVLENLAQQSRPNGLACMNRHHGPPSVGRRK